MRPATLRDVLVTISLLGLFVIVLILAGCNRETPTEPRMLEVVKTPTPAVTPTWDMCAPHHLHVYGSCPGEPTYTPTPRPKP